MSLAEKSASKSAGDKVTFLACSPWRLNLPIFSCFSSQLPLNAALLLPCSQMAALDDTDKNIEMWKIKRVCSGLLLSRRLLLHGGVH